MNTHRALTIGLFTDDFFGGVLRAVEVQAAELAKQGHRVIIIGPKRPVEPLPHGCEYRPVRFLWHKRLADYMGFISWSDKTVQQLTTEYQFDIIHSHNERGSMFLCAKIAKKTGVPHVHTFHSNYAGTHAENPFFAAISSMVYLPLALMLLGRYSRIKPLRHIHKPQKVQVLEHSTFARHDWLMVAKMAQYVDVYTSPAPFLIDIVNECTCGALNKKGFFIANGISPEFAAATRTRALTGPIQFMSCGRLDPEKRIDIIIRAMAKIKGPAITLSIIGNGSQQAALQALVKKLGLKKRVKFLGRINNREQLAKEYANADIFLFPSYHFETQGLVLGEAACAGEAIIYCDERLKVGVNPHNSLFVAPTTLAFADAMQALIADKKQVRAMQAASKKLCAPLSPTAMAQKMLALYYGLLQ